MYCGADIGRLFAAAVTPVPSFWRASRRCNQFICLRAVGKPEIEGRRLVETSHLAWIGPIRSRPTFKTLVILRRLAARSPARLGDFNISRRRRAAGAGSCWRGERHGAAFPRSNGVDDDPDSGERALDLTLHALNLGIEKSLQLLQLRR